MKSDTFRRSLCPHATVAAPQLDELVWSDVVALLSDPQILLAAWREQHKIDRSSSLTAEEVKVLKRQLRDGERQCKRLVDAYEKGVIELDELTSRRNAIEQKLDSVNRKFDDLSRQAAPGLSFLNLETSIEEVCRRLCGQLKGVGVRKRMQLCRTLIDKVVVKNRDVQIYYKLPVSGNCSKELDRRGVLQSAEAALLTRPHDADRVLGGHFGGVPRYHPPRKNQPTARYEGRFRGVNCLGPCPPNRGRSTSDIMKKLDRARRKLEELKPRCTQPRQRKAKK